jgi:hypothetical protein
MQEVFSMYRIELTYGHRRRTGEPLLPIDVSTAEQQALNFFTESFHGGQVYRRIGGYLSNDHLIVEPCTVIWALAEQVEGHIERVWALASTLAAQLEQECVLVSITRFDGLVGWVEP